MQTSRRIFLQRSALGLAGLACGSLGSWSNQSWIPDGSLQAQIPQMLKQFGLTNMSMSILEGGKSWSKHFITDNAPPGFNIFEAGSLSKPIAAVLALQLKNRGQFMMDRPLSQYWIPEDLTENTSAAAITARHILSHSSGLQNWRFRDTDQLSLKFEPGSGYQYSGEGFVWLQQVFEKITGMGYSELASTQVFEPLGMQNSSFCFTSGLFEQMTPGYKTDGSLGDDYSKQMGQTFWKLAKSAGKDLSNWTMDDALSNFNRFKPDLPALPVFVSPNAAGSLSSSSEDYLKFVNAILSKDSRLSLNENDYESLFTPLSKVSDTIDWGLGWGIAGATSGQPIIFHTSETRFYKGVAVIQPGPNRALVMLTNGANGDRVYDPIARKVTGLSLEFLNSF